jgi:hypothetical protein
VIVLLLSVSIALTLAWAFDVTAQGIKTTRQLSARERTVGAT